MSEHAQRGTVLAIGAHPDDEVLGVGGTLAKHAAANHDVHVLIVTEGTTAQYDDESVIAAKREAACRCARKLGVTDVRFGELPDMRLDSVDHIQVNEIIEEAVADLNPDVVYTHSAQEVNKDHIAVHESTLVATRPPTNVSRVYAYEAPSSTEWTVGEHRFAPSVYVDITDQLDKKVAAFQEYETEVREPPHPRSPSRIRSLAKHRGSAAGFDAAEAYELLRQYGDVV